MRAPRLRALLILSAAACGGGLPLDGVDAGLDASTDTIDDVAETSVDATTDDVVDAGTDSSDASLDVVEAEAEADTSCPIPIGLASDASVDLDAATAPWALVTGQTVRYDGLGIDTSGHVIAVGGDTANASAFIVQTTNESGDAGWSKAAGSNATQYASSVATDAAGFVYVTGSTQGTLDLGGGALGPGTFVVKYDSTGAFVWEFGPFNGATFSGVRVKSNGDVVIGGSLGGTVDFGGGKRIPVGDTDAVLVEVTSCGNYVRDAQWGDSGGQEIDAVALDSSDDIFVGGRFYGAIDFGGGSMTGPTSSSDFNLFIAKLDANGSYLHQLNANGDGNNSIGGLVTDANGSVTVAGTHSGTIDWGGGALVASGYEDVYLAKLDGSLGHLWSHAYGQGPNSSTTGYALAADPLGGVVVTGFYSGNDGTLDFGQGALPSNAQFGGAFFAWFDSNGVSKASLGLANSASGTFTPLGLAFASWPDVIVSGQCAGSVTIPSGMYTCYSEGSGFIARLSP